METVTTPLQTKTEIAGNRVRVKLIVNGIVQGVGFRPFIFNLAKRHHLTGFVTNTGQGVLIEVQGSASAIQTFINALRSEAPPLSRIDELVKSEIPVRKDAAFTIRSSESNHLNQTFIAPDTAVCPDCLRELFDPSDRRYLYPFINCTNCGPRFTIIEKVPYDRPFTTMAPFTMCAECEAEYQNPANRRFHAQPNACPVCGPQVWLESAGVDSPPLAEKDAAFDEAVTLLQQGKILAIKGLGGFHLAVDAANTRAVTRLRMRKLREEKPFALMLADLNLVKKICDVTPKETALLTSTERPIVLLKKKETNLVSEQIAPANHRLGVMLPYTPLHYILLRRLAERTKTESFYALVMTSANRSDEPIVIDNAEAQKRLDGIADAYLLHNRDILIRSDDSVLFVQKETSRLIRRSRGYVPRPISVAPTPEPILAVGGELKNTICLLKDKHAFVSQHIGDLENFRAHTFFEETVRHFQSVFTCMPNIIAHDMHPGYFSTQWAQQQSGRTHFAIQHHHAHMAACMAEYNIQGPVLGLILDGTGYGTDHTIWGGELLLGNYTTVKRLNRLEPMPIPGGEIAIRQPWRLALGYLYTSFKGHIPILPSLKDKPIEAIREILEKEINCPLTSSCGRLFDAAAAICGVRTTIHYEAQAAIEFTQLAEDLNEPAYSLPEFENTLPVSSIIKAVTHDVLSGVPVGRISARFHQTLIRMFTKAVTRVADRHHVRTVILSGGVFQNEILLNGLQDALQKLSFEVLIPTQLPVNDGGISLGQAAIARELIKIKQNQVIWT